MISPLLLLVFNRPEKTRQVFEAVRAARPAKLYVAADGARPHKAGEAVLCAEVRRIFEQVDWPCELKTLYREQNLGCRQAVTGAINWLFQHEEYGIVLEDDCVPAPDFFRYCDWALEKYKDEPRVMHVGAAVVIDAPWKEDVGFSRLVPVHGWATWRRAWRLFDMDMSRIGELEKLPLRPWYRTQAKNVRRAIERIHSRNVDAWGARWVLSVMVRHGLTVLPRTNLITNIGWGADATHTKYDSHLANLPLGRLSPVLSVRAEMEADPVFDEAYLSFMNRKPPLPVRLFRKARELLGA